MLFQASKHLLKVWLATTRASIVREMEFRANFVAGLIRQALWLGIFVFMIEVIFHNTEQLAGWDRPDALLIVGLSRMIEGMMGVFFVSNIMRLPQQVQTGEFDFYLTKPVPVTWYVAFQRTHIDNIGNVLAGCAIAAYAFAIREAAVSPALLGAGVVIALAGVAIYFSLLMIIATLVFLVDRLEFLWGFNVLLSEPLTFPFDVFPRIPQVALTYLVPIAFVVFVPAQAFTGRLSWWHLPVSIGLAIVFLILASLAWRVGLRRYSSASS